MFYRHVFGSISGGFCGISRFYGNFAGFRGNTRISRVCDRAKFQKPCKKQKKKLKFAENNYFTGLLIFCDVAISHNWPQIATFRIIRQKSHNSGKIAKEQGNIRFLLKFYDNLSVVLRWFTSQKTLEITKIVRERSIDQTGSLCVVLHVGDLVLVLNRSDCFNIGKE